jgi:hypothetical protein
MSELLKAVNQELRDMESMPFLTPYLGKLQALLLPLKEHLEYGQASAEAEVEERKAYGRS